MNPKRFITTLMILLSLATAALAQENRLDTFRLLALLGLACLPLVLLFRRAYSRPSPAAH